jgi:hypothetical protein
MSTWRRVAIEKMPRLREVVADSVNIYDLWNGLFRRFLAAHSDPTDDELIGQIYEYAWWCVSARDDNTRNAGLLSFFEDLPLHPGVWPHMAKWLSAEEFSGMGEIFYYHLRSYRDYRTFVRKFYEGRERLGAAAAQCDWKPLTDEELAARVSESVTHFREWKRQHGRLQFEFLARIYVVENREVMERLAPVLQQSRGDAQAVARAIVPVFRSLVRSGQDSFPADAFALAAAAVLLSGS